MTEKQDQLLNKLTQLYIWSKPDLFTKDITKVTVKWFCYFNSWGVTIMKHYQVGNCSETLSKDPVCKYIIEECFDKTQWGNNYREIEILPPCGHEGIEAVVQLTELLELDENMELFV